jgi:hypothetical protein
MIVQRDSREKLSTQIDPFLAVGEPADALVAAEYCSACLSSTGVLLI